MNFIFYYTRGIANDPTLKAKINFIEIKLINFFEQWALVAQPGFTFHMDL